MPGDFRCDRCEYSCAFIYTTKPHTRLRVHRAPGIPARPLSSGAQILRQQLGRIAPRGREVMTVVTLRHATKNQGLASVQHGLLRGACHRAARWADPLARNDGARGCAAPVRHSAAAAPPRHDVQHGSAEWPMVQLQTTGRRGMTAAPFPMFSPDEVRTSRSRQHTPSSRCSCGC
jgi:hypothetical protein